MLLLAMQMHKGKKMLNFTFTNVSNNKAHNHGLSYRLCRDLICAAINNNQIVAFYMFKLQQFNP